MSSYCLRYPRSAEQVFVTVGTTDFNELIRVVDSEEFVLILVNLNCKKISIQIGRGLYQPQRILHECSRRGIECCVFRFKSTLDVEMLASSLIISHCGAGSILEAISLQKDLVVVVNLSLQGNHQTELATALSAKKYCFSTVPCSLIALLSSEEMQFQDCLQRFPEAEPDIFPKILDSLFGFGHDTAY